MDVSIRYANITLDLCAAVFCLAGLVSIGLFSLAPRDQKATLRATFASFTLLALGDGVAGMFAGRPGETAHIMVLAGNAVGYCACFALAAAFTFYLRARIEAPPPEALIPQAASPRSGHAPSPSQWPSAWC